MLQRTAMKPSRKLLPLLLAALAAVARCRPAWQQTFEPETPYLLKQRDAITNWEAFASGNGIAGWSDNSSVPFCQWQVRRAACSPPGQCFVCMGWLAAERHTATGVWRCLCRLSGLSAGCT
ncbi:hypothetical protein ABPG75_003910 [Micractinium tetrahymenae]